MAWTIADVWEAIAAAQPDYPAQVQGERVITWSQFDARADALAAHFIASGMGHQAKVAGYLYNGPEYLETYFAAFKGGFAPVNTNYRYGPEEIIYLFDNADAEAVVFHAGFTDLLERIKDRLPKVKAWVAVAEPGHPAPAWAADYDAIVAKAPAQRPVKAPWGRSGDDLLLLYTGGTTGMPKGVMWRQDDLFQVLGAGGNAALGIAPATSIPELIARIQGPEHLKSTAIVAAPLMHGTGQFSAFISLNGGGTICTLPSRKFNAVELWNETQRLKATNIVLVGLAFSTPMLEALEANPGGWDLTSVRAMSSSGSMWSQENKRGLLSHIPGAMIADSFGSSEAVGLGASASAAGAEAQTAAFMLGPNTGVFTEDGLRVAPGSGERGLVAVSGFLPAGYYKDEEKSAKTFKIIEGVRWSVPGDWAEVNVDGTLKLLGRGSVCINTGGEKVFPEEVEEALKRHADIRDAVVVGIADSRFGERICAVVEPEAGATPTLAALSEHVRGQLAAYKAPRELVVVDSIGRAPNGKVDYKAIKDRALAALGVAA
ncbi:MAG: acyl-CoA synthetase [Alphaproteobacteria bacterium]|nr:acyl-CoA synthetase [Alphaproteobacteria bacterium]MBU1516926.1 acyl-CoA synthetase [Alphaproteobacteria bacterium]MBU2095814.1 acyl-CoA synthetase [Alphaproteobacteria bacterium]MBU2152049.1 acyl-CoA synthetase [Alphaproteobacteria bacterium]MBU2309570.1 acyl-CoA synthetase [Alphaproteobacteria bacterium]